MIPFANLHDDIGNDIYDYRETQPNRLDDFHYPRFKKGNMKFSAIVCCFGHNQSWKEMQDTILYAKNAILQSQYFSFSNDKEIQVFLAVEGMSGIQEDVSDKIHWLYDNYVRLGSLCWNDRNALACGAKSGNEPLTEKGIEAIQTMNNCNMAIDVSHCCEWNFYDIAKYSTQPIIASHSNVKHLYNHYRNLTDGQLQVIKNKLGLVGAIPIRWFVKPKEENANLQDFIAICSYLKEKITTSHMALGFDFMDYMESLEDSNVIGMKNITEIQNLSNALKTNGFSDEEILQITYQNAYQFMAPYLNYTFSS